jgi:hypothetical protein
MEYYRYKINFSSQIRNKGRSQACTAQDDGQVYIVIQWPYKTSWTSFLATKSQGYIAIRIHELMTIQTYTGFYHTEDINPSKELQLKH